MDSPEKPEPLFGYFDIDIFDCPPFIMFSNGDCPRVHDIVTLGNFEPVSMKLWCALARRASAIIDVGAHVGVYSLAAAALRGDIQIHAFEPNPYAAARLRVNKQRNGFAQITEHLAGLADQTGVTTMGWLKKTGQISSGGALGEHASMGEKAERAVANIVRFDELNIPLGERGLVKIDVEGAEVMALRGMRRALEQRPDIILECLKPANTGPLNEILLPLGYRVWVLDEAHGPVPVDEVTFRKLSDEGFNHFLSVRADAVDGM